MKIAFDVDGVVLNSIRIILEYVNRVKGTKWMPADLLSWDLDRLGIDMKTLWDGVDYMYSKPRIEPYEGATEVLRRVYRETGTPLLFITGRRDLESARNQLEALDWDGCVPEIIVTGGTRYKLPYLLENSVDFIVEDDPEHIAQYLEQRIGVGLMLRPWNREVGISVTERFSGWSEFEHWYFGTVRRDPFQQCKALSD